MLRHLEDTLNPFTNKKEINTLFDQALRHCPNIVSTLGTELGPQKQLSKLTNIIQNADPIANGELLNVALNSLGQSVPSLISAASKDPQLLKRINEQLDPLQDKEAI